MHFALTSARNIVSCHSLLEPSCFFTDGTPLADPIKCRRIVVALQCLALTRPDIQYVVNQLFQFMHNLTSAHFVVVNRTFRSIKGTLVHGLSFYEGSPIDLVAFPNTDWASNPDDHSSTSGYFVFLGSSLISWSCKKQPTNSG